MHGSLDPHNDISIGSTVFAQPTVCPTQTQTNRHIGHATCGICSNRPHLSALPRVKIRRCGLLPNNFRHLLFYLPSFSTTSWWKRLSYLYVIKYTFIDRHITFWFCLIVINNDNIATVHTILQKPRSHGVQGVTWPSRFRVCGPHATSDPHFLSAIPTSTPTFRNFSWPQQYWQTFRLQYHS